ncbi:MAG: hypothetical protein ACMV1B_13255 [Prevotella sp.]
MNDILFGILIGIGISYIAHLSMLAYRKLRVIIKEDKERRKLYYGLSKSKRTALDEVIRTYKSVVNDLNALNNEDMAPHRFLRNVVETLQNRTMNTALTIGGESGIKYVRRNTHILDFELDKK